MVKLGCLYSVTVSHLKTSQRILPTRVFLSFFKQWGIYIGQGIIALLGLIGAGYIAGIPRNSYNAAIVDVIIVGYFATAGVWRRLRPRSKLAMEYARRAYRSAAWILTVGVATIAPTVYALLPFLGQAGDIVQNTALVIGILSFVTLLGIIMSIADGFKQSEDEIIKKFEAENPQKVTG